MSKRIIKVGFIIVFSASWLAAQEVITAPKPVDGLPPAPAPIAIDPNFGGGGRAAEQTERSVDREALQADLEALLRVKDRVLRRLKAGEIPGQDPQQVLTELARNGFTDDQSPLVGTPDGPPIVSNHLEVVVQPLVGTSGVLGGGEALVTASIRDEPVEVVYRELVALRGYSLDDQQVSSGRRRVALHVDNLTWGETLDRVLGQAGLAWRRGLDDKIEIYEISRDPLTKDQRLRLAERAFIAAGSDPSDPRSAEARYLRAKQYHDGKELMVALAAYEEVFKDLDRSHPQFGTARPWVRLAIRGMGDVMMEMEQYRDARSVYLNYKATAHDGDADKPEVTLQAALAARMIGVDADGVVRDPTALTQAEDLLDELLKKYDRPGAGHDAVVARARLELGNLLFDQGKYNASRGYLKAHAHKVGEQAGDRLLFLIAECDYQLARQAHAEYRYNASDRLMASAREIYQQLFESFQRGAVDPLVANGSDIYRMAAYRIGLTWQQLEQPDYVRALLAFLRARQEFHNTPLEGELLVHITRSYAELERHEHSVETLWELLAKKEDGLSGTQAVVEEIESLLGDIEVNLKDYEDTIKAKALFYIAQRRFLVAKRDPRQREDQLGRAIHTYQRVLAQERVTPELRMATHLGLGRAALELGDEELGVSFLRTVLADRQAAARDRAYAAQLLGDHFRANGDFERALQFYSADRGEVTE